MKYIDINSNPQEVFDELEKFIAEKVKYSNVSYSVNKEIKEKEKGKELILKVIFSSSAPYTKKELIISMDFTLLYVITQVYGKVYLDFEENEEGKREMSFEIGGDSTTASTFSRIKKIIAPILIKLLETTSTDETILSEIKKRYYKQLLDEKVKNFLSTLSDDEKKVFYAIFGKYSYRDSYMTISHNFTEEFINEIYLKEDEDYYWFCSLINNPEFKEALQRFSKVIKQSFVLYKI